MAKQKFPATPIRKGLYAKINIGRNELRWDDDDYRQVIADRFDGATSLTQLNVSELENLLEHMKGCGFKVKRKQGPRRGPPAAGTRPLASEPDAKKIRALWLSLYHLGVPLADVVGLHVGHEEHLGIGHRTSPGLEGVWVYLSVLTQRPGPDLNTPGS